MRVLIAITKSSFAANDLLGRHATLDTDISSFVLVSTLVLQCAYPVPVRAIPTSLPASSPSLPSINSVGPSDVATESTDENEVLKIQASLLESFSAGPEPVSEFVHGPLSTLGFHPQPGAVFVGRMQPSPQLVQFLRSEGLGTGALSPSSAMIYPLPPINLSPLQQQQQPIQQSPQQQGLQQQCLSGATSSDDANTAVATSSSESQESINAQQTAQAQSEPVTTTKRTVEASASDCTGATATAGPPKSFPPLYPGNNGLLCYFDASSRSTLHCSDGASYQAIKPSSSPPPPSSRTEIVPELDGTEANVQQQQPQATLQKRVTASDPSSREESTPHVVFPIGSHTSVPPALRDLSYNQVRGPGSSSGAQPTLHSNSVPETASVRYSPKYKGVRDRGMYTGTDENASLSKRSSSINSNFGDRNGAMGLGASSMFGPGFAAGFADKFDPFTTASDWGMANGAGSGLSSPWLPSSTLSASSPFGPFGGFDSPGYGWPSSPSQQPSFPSFAGSGSFDWSKYSDHFNDDFDPLFKREDRIDEGVSSKYHDGNRYSSDVGAYGSGATTSTTGDRAWKREDGVESHSNHGEASTCGPCYGTDSFGPGYSFKDKRQLVPGTGPMAAAAAAAAGLGSGLNFGLGQRCSPGLGPIGAGPTVIPVPIEINTLVYPDGQTILLPPDGVSK
ncbi:MAG: hypothetical protein J3Q66DRAFT_405689 [Benniella sp.]|nr:MAG: hypothetical protein J3Q66DRAFT_405689 [Benniella sp.]